MALISGPAYDQVDAALAAYTAEHGIKVEVAFRGDEFALKTHLDDALPGGERYDIVSTHTKYLSSHAAWFQPIDPWLDFVEGGTFHPTALDLCRIDGRLVCLPRNVDARLLMAWTDALPSPDWQPASWSDLANVARSAANDTRAGFAFPTRGPDLWATYCELAAALGEKTVGSAPHLTAGNPEMDGGRPALAWLVDVVQAAAPRSMVPTGWCADEVSAAFVAGEVAMVGDWPVYWGGYPSHVKDRITVFRSPPGVDGGRSVVAGCHGWAIPADARDPLASATLLRRLSSASAAHADAVAGMVPVRLDVAMPADHPLDFRRANLLQLTIVDDLLPAPSSPGTLPQEEEAANTIRSALLGERSIADAALAAHPHLARRLECPITSDREEPPATQP